ncbi:hypothetical protein L3Q82_017665 [Scortum barcoo]|uniref:Uncharacterized protein n=1 Tax=Scortum barcoo TaxID=214431 RepID=A0ACB8VLB3_9TELE|nr:hypothetical protein L3Q82_017665 [Scortum barcoo]
MALRVCSIQGDHTSQPPGKVSTPGYWRGEFGRLHLIQEEQCGFRPWSWNTGPALYLHRVLEGLWSLPNQSTCALWIWRRHSIVSLRGILWGCSMVWGPGAFANGCLGLCTTEQELGLHCRHGWDENLHLQIRGYGSRSRGGMPFQVGGEVLPQVEEFNLAVLFTKVRERWTEIDRRIGAAPQLGSRCTRPRQVKKGAESKALLDHVNLS